MTKLQAYANVAPYITKDGSEIRELMHPAIHGNQAQSLAEASIQPGCRTELHRHAITEELYHITAGRGLMTLGNENFPVQPGDTICIPPGTPHCIEALGKMPLKLLCCCSPAYDHADTELLQGRTGQRVDILRKYRQVFLTCRRQRHFQALAEHLLKSASLSTTSHR